MSSGNREFLGHLSLRCYLNFIINTIFRTKALNNQGKEEEKKISHF